MNNEADKPLINPIKLRKMIFIFNALDNGWSIIKKKDKYVFTKPHENKKEVFLDDFLQKFIYTNMTINDI